MLHNCKHAKINQHFFTPYFITNLWLNFAQKKYCHEIKSKNIQRKDKHIYILDIYVYVYYLK